MGKEYQIEKFFPSAEYVIENAFIYSWECDIFLQMKSGYHYEIEKKISRSDFKADFKKSAKHFQLENHKKELITIPGGKNYQQLNNEQINKFEIDISDLIIRKIDYNNTFLVNLANNVNFRKNKLPNRFFYLTPKGLLNKKEIPDYAGLLEYDEGEIIQIKSAKWLHKNKYNYDKIMLDKYRWRYENMKSENESLRRILAEFNDIYEDPVKYLQTEIDF